MSEERTDGDLLRERLGLMEDVQKAIASLGKEMFDAASGAIFAVDLLAVGALNRSTAHCAGIKPLIEARNIMCAGSILRLQLDTALRFFACFLVENPHEFALAVLEGTPVKSMKAGDGSQMHDAYLVKVLGESYSWVPRVYKESSGYIHFSEKHLLSTIFLDERGGFKFKVSPLDPETPDMLFLEILEAFYASIDLLGYLVKVWISQKKDLPLTGARNPSEGDARR